MQGDLINIFEKGPQETPPSLVGIKTGQAYLTYCSSIINMGGGSFLEMLDQVHWVQNWEIFCLQQVHLLSLTAQKIARAFNDCLSTLLTVFQTTIVTAPGFGSLVPELIDLFSTPKPSATLFATKFATALNNFTSAAVISGVVPGTPPVPFTGPPS